MSFTPFTRKVTAGFLFFAILATSFPLFAFAALPAGFEMEILATGLTQPTTMTFTNDGRIFIAQKNGVVRVLKNGTLLPLPLITLTDVNTYGDRGLIGMAVDPNFSLNHYLYLLYTYENTPGANFAGSKTGRLVRVTVSGDTADESTKVVLVGTIGGSLATPSCENFVMGVDCIPSDSPSHSVGGLRFGPDGKLYVSLGEGSAFDYADPRAMRSQNLDSLGGKILRINTDGTAPSDNPFYNGSSTANRSKVYAYGFRNDFRFNFHPTTGVLYSGDVGWSSWEEVNKVLPGNNYGWPCYEGVNQTVGFNCTLPSHTDPFYTYPHDVNGAGSVTAGAFPTAYPALYNNSFFFGDYAQNWIKRLTLDNSGNFTGIVDVMSAADGTKGPVDVITGPDGNIYWIGIYDGSVRRLLYTTGNRQPIANITATPTSGLTPLTVNFSGASSSDPDSNPLTYSWSFGDGSSSTLANPTHTYTTNGNYNASLTVFDGQGGQNTKSISIAAGNQAPTATITAPANGSLYKVGDTIQLSAVATDPEDGSLPDSAFTWDVILHHNTHVHYYQTLTGKNPTFQGIDHQAATDVYTEVRLTVTDSGGLTDVRSISLYQNNNQVGTGNLILNPSLETAASNTTSFPAHWGEAGYGVNNAIYTYPIPGQDGASAARVQVTSYSSGDAKWGFDPVSIQEGATYSFSNYYISNVSNGLVLQVLKADGTYSYMDLGDAPAVATWTKLSRTFTTPIGARSVTVFQTLNSIGTLDIDNFSMTFGTSTPAATDTQAPVVAVVSPDAGNIISGTTTLVSSATDNVGIVDVRFFVDATMVKTLSSAPYLFAWNSKSVADGAHTITAVARDAAGNTATSSIVNITVQNQIQSSGGGTNLVPNPSVEVSGAVSGIPQSWFTGKYGTNSTTFTYPAAGFDGARGLKVQMTSYSTGDAKWYVQEVPVTPGTTYTFSDYYQSNVSTLLQLRLTSTSNVLSYKTLATLPAAANWTKASYTYTIPAGIKSITIFHILKAVGTLSTDLYSVTTGTGGGADTTLPTVVISDPSNNGAVSGTTTLRAQAADASGIAGVRFFVDGIRVGNEILTSPYEYLLNTAALSNATHTITAVARDAAGNTATSSVVNIVVNNTTPDTQSPNVNWVSPVGSQNVTGTVNLSVAATDNIGVTSVDFIIDSTSIGSDTVAPYEMTWNSTLATNGNHNLTAVAHDAAGNTNSQSILVTVTNSTSTATTTPMGPNLIANGNLESVNGVDPQGWHRGGWGTNNRTFTYPITGFNGGKAARVAMTTYTDGDAKWYFDKINVTPGTQYNFSGWYKADTILDVIGEYTMSDNSLLYVGITKENQATTTWAKLNANFTPPTGATTLTLYPLISAIGTLDIDDFSINAVGTTTVNTDTLAPVVSIVSPVNNATVSGVISVNATATDNVGVKKVWMAVDGNVFGPQMTAAPYSVSLDTATLTNGAHVLKATAEDAVGNNSTGTSTIIVNNSSTTTATTTSNLIENPSLEIAGANNTPQQWFKGGWGTNAVTYTYPVAGQDGLAGAQLQITSYTDGDAKWYFAPKTVIPGNTYTYSNYYKSSATSTETVRYTLSNGSFVYTDIAVLPPVANWTKYSTQLTPPASTTAVTVFHELRSVGTLTVDNYSLAPLTIPTDPTLFASGMVSLTFDDGWVSQYTDAMPILNNAGLKGSFEIISLETMDALPYNRFSNPSLENNDGAGNPTDWFKSSWGTNDAQFIYPVSGQDGASAAKIMITNYTDGDAKWYMKDATVVDGAGYTVSDYYMSDATTTVTARYNMGSSTYVYADLATLPPTATWAQFTKQITMPANVESFTIFHHLNSAGSLTIDNVNFSKVQIYVTPSQVLQMQSAGHEIGAHSRTHPSLSNIPQAQMESEINGSRSDLLGIGATPVDMLVYPYGDYNAAVESTAQAAGFIGGRSVDRGYNNKTTDKYALKIQQVDVATTVDQVKAWIDTATQNKTWLILMFHQVDTQGLELSVTPPTLQAIVDYLKTNNIHVVTMHEGIGQMTP